MKTSALSTYAALVAGPCPPMAELLLSAAGVLADGEHDAATPERLDEDARHLFGIAAQPADEAARSLAVVLARELGYVVRRDGPRSLLLPDVVRRREGHPVLLAAIATELVRRAGGASCVVSATTGWHVGLGGEDDAVLVAMEGSPSHAARAMARRCCGHEVARVALHGLERAYGERGDEDAARRAAGLRTLLPAGASPFRA